MARSASSRTRDAEARSRKSNRDLKFLLVFCMLAFVLFCALVYVQIIKAGEYSLAATKRRTSDITISARRGTIYDRYGKVLATTVDAITIYANPNEITDPNGEAQTLASILDVDEDTLVDKLSRSESTFVYVSRKADVDVANEVKGLGLPGIYFLDDSKRVYPNGSSGVQVLGLVDTDDNGLSGLELEYNDVLKGTDGELLYERGRNNIPISGGLSQEVAAQDGNDVVTTIDLEMQQYIEQRLAATVADSGAKGGDIVVYDSSTGEIYACASAPLPNSSDVHASSSASLNLAALSSSYEPGSTFKAITAASAVDAGTVSKDTEFDVPSQLQVYDRTIKDDEEHGEETLTTTQIIEQSSNIGIDLVERTLGDDLFYHYMVSFGIGQDTGVDFPGASSGTLLDISKWSGITGQNMPFGQGLATSSLQMTRAFGVFANGGVLATPHFLLNLPQSSEQRSWATTQVISAQSASTMTYMLTRVVTNGTAKAAAVPGYTTAGKTATAQYLQANGTYSTDSSNVTFIGYLPKTTSKIVCSTTLYSPQGDYKSTYLFSDVMSYIATRCKLAPA